MLLIRIFVLELVSCSIQNSVARDRIHDRKWRHENMKTHENIRIKDTLNSASKMFTVTFSLLELNCVFAYPTLLSDIDCQIGVSTCILAWFKNWQIWHLSLRIKNYIYLSKFVIFICNTYTTKYFGYFFHQLVLHIMCKKIVQWHPTCEQNLQT